MFKYKPERNPRQAVLLVVCLAVLSCAGFYAASLAHNAYRLIAQLTAVMFLVMSVSLVIRYTLTEMEYTVSTDAFIISKTIGSRSSVLCTVDLTTAIALVDKKTYLHTKELSDVSAKFNFCQNIKAQSFVFIFMYKGKRSMIEFEPNETFAKLMSEAIDNAKKNDGDKKDDQSTPKGTVTD